MLRIGLDLVSTPTDSLCDADSDDDRLSDEGRRRAPTVSARPIRTIPTPTGTGWATAIEDANHDGRVNAALETDPTLTDTDSDGLRDGAEDANQNGIQDPGETDPTPARQRWRRHRRRRGDRSSAPIRSNEQRRRWAAGRPRDRARRRRRPRSRTDPRVADSDGDELSDGAEDINHNGRVDPGETNPSNRDTDSGGVDDGQEVLTDGTDPLEPSDDVAGEGSERRSSTRLPTRLRRTTPCLGRTDPTSTHAGRSSPTPRIRGTGCSIVAVGSVGSGALPGGAGTLAGLVAATLALTLSRRRR